MELPAIFREPRFPLRLSCPVELARSWYVYPGNVVSLTRDGVLLLWDGNAARRPADRRGVARRFDPVVLVAVGTATGWTWSSASAASSGLRAVRYDRGRDEARVSTLKLDHMHPSEVVGAGGGHVLVFFPDQTVAAVSLATGETAFQRRWKSTSSAWAGS